jgi:hypothetical protein
MKPTYVRAGKLDDGTFGVLRTGECVFYYTSKKAANEGIRPGDIVVDATLIVDRGLLNGCSGVMHIAGRRR